MHEKSRFLRLLDLSLRSTILPTQLIASFLKRLARVCVVMGESTTPQDLMFVISFVSNLFKRHPICMRLIHRPVKLGRKNYVSKDPFDEDEVDPMDTQAIKSCLWELEVIMKHHYDSRIRNFTKIFKTDISRKSAFYKCEDYT